MIDRLVDLDTLTMAESDYLTVLSDLVEQYEMESHPIPPASDAEILQHLSDAQGATQAQIEQATGISSSLLSEIFGGKRNLDREQIGKLAHFFQVSPTVFTFEA